MAVGVAYPSPETGWTRIETLDDHYRYLFDRSLHTYISTDETHYSGGDRLIGLKGVVLKFKGTGFRIIHTKMAVTDEINDVYLDNVHQGYYDTYVYGIIDCASAFEVTNLEDKEHVLKVIPRTIAFRWDCVDIRRGGGTLHT